MGCCINSSRVIIIHSMESFKREARQKLEESIVEYLDNKDYTLSDDNSCFEQSQIPIQAKMKNSELIFL